MRVEGKLEDGEILNENLLRKEESPRDNSVNVHAEPIKDIL